MDWPNKPWMVPTRYTSEVDPSLQTQPGTQHHHDERSEAEVEAILNGEASRDRIERAPLPDLGDGRPAAHLVDTSPMDYTRRGDSVLDVPDHEEYSSDEPPPQYVPIVNPGTGVHFPIPPTKDQELQAKLSAHNQDLMRERIRGIVEPKSEGRPAPALWPPEPKVPPRNAPVFELLAILPHIGGPTEIECNIMGVPMKATAFDVSAIGYAMVNAAKAANLVKV